jgi:hypothetical protein
MSVASAEQTELRSQRSVPMYYSEPLRPATIEKEEPHVDIHLTNEIFLTK